MYVDGGWEEVHCTLVLAGIILMAGQLSEVTTTVWTMGIGSRLRYKFVFVTARRETETRPVCYTIHVRFFFYRRVA